MKKILFTTTALVAGAMISSAAMADGMAATRYSSSMKSSSMSSANQLQSTRYAQQNDMMGASAFTATVGGYANWMIGYVDNSERDELSAMGRSLNEFDVMGNAEVHFDFAATLKNGMTIGAKSQLVADTTSQAGEIDQAYMYVESMYGKVMVGRHDNVNEQLSIHAIDLGALDIQETELTNWVVPIFLVSGSPEMSATYFTEDSRLTKISYITPSFSGFQAGLTYAPRGEASKDSVVFEPGNETDGTILTAAYNGKYNDVAYGISAGYATNSGVSNSKWNIGGRIGYQGFTVSSAFKDVDMSSIGINNATVWDAGITYEQGPYGISLSYIASEMDASSVTFEYTTMLLSGVYNMAAGVDAFATIGYGDYGIALNVPVPTPFPTKNDGFAVIGGMMLSF